MTRLELGAQLPPSFTGKQASLQMPCALRAMSRVFSFDQTAPVKTLGQYDTGGFERYDAMFCRDGVGSLLPFGPAGSGPLARVLFTSSMTQDERDVHVDQNAANIALRDMWATQTFKDTIQGPAESFKDVNEADAGHSRDELINILASRTDDNVDQQQKRHYISRTGLGPDSGPVSSGITPENWGTYPAEHIYDAAVPMNLSRKLQGGLRLFDIISSAVRRATDDEMLGILQAKSISFNRSGQDDALAIVSSGGHSDLTSVHDDEKGAVAVSLTMTYHIRDTISH